jgi:hypothetical protein
MMIYHIDLNKLNRVAEIAEKLVDKLNEVEDLATVTSFMTKIYHNELIVALTLLNQPQVENLES